MRRVFGGGVGVDGDGDGLCGWRGAVVEREEEGEGVVIVVMGHVLLILFGSSTFAFGVFVHHLFLAFFFFFLALGAIRRERKGKERGRMTYWVAWVRNILYDEDRKTKEGREGLGHVKLRQGSYLFAKRERERKWQMYTIYSRKIPRY